MPVGRAARGAGAADGAGRRPPTGWTASRAEALLTGPIGRVDPVSLRQLRRALRRADRSRRPRFRRPARRGARAGNRRLPAGHLARPLQAGARGARRRAAQRGRRRRPALHPVAGLAAQRSAAALAGGRERGGAGGAQADARPRRRHGAVRRHRALRVAHRRGIAVAVCSSTSRALGLPPVGARRRRPTSTAVTVLSAHAALGREWDVVVIAGLQEGLWPNTTPRGGVLGTQRLRRRPRRGRRRRRRCPARAPLLAEERRLLIAAMGRARSRLLVTAVDSDAGDDVDAAVAVLRTSSRTFGDRHRDRQPPSRCSPRGCWLPAPVVGRLRAVVCAPEGAVDDAVRACAAAQLARLAAAGVPGADPGAVVRHDAR